MSRLKMIVSISRLADRKTMRSISSFAVVHTLDKYAEAHTLTSSIQLMRCHVKLQLSPTSPDTRSFLINVSMAQYGATTLNDNHEETPIKSQQLSRQQNWQWSAECPRDAVVIICTRPSKAAIDATRLRTIPSRRHNT